MSVRKYIKPSRPGLKVRVAPPCRDFLPENGRLVIWGAWWSSKLREGDVIVCEAPTVDPKPSEEEK